MATLSSAGIGGAPYVVVFANNQQIIKVLDDASTATAAVKPPLKAADVATTTTIVDHVDDLFGSGGVERMKERFLSAMVVGCLAVVEAVANGFGASDDDESERHRQQRDEDEVATMNESWMPSWGLGDLSYYCDETSSSY
jgi:hypothetical protein